jgi:NAD(P)-dependent dehydrogenase (short-subunit alcohol dehydrogenase family)
MRPQADAGWLSCAYVQHIAQAAFWLSSDAAAFTIGHALAVDGGYLAR